jgi:2-keto-4-pentenoate hydratase/2-oxohepta-3-ene-1,7-dioic acid hydratase in catechol pathway
MKLCLFDDFIPGKITGERMNYVFGYTCMMDLSARDPQRTQRIRTITTKKV